MNWAFWAIPLIGLAVWVLSTVFRDLDERMEKERRAKREAADGGRPVRVPRPSNTELDKFLEEARRRRESPPKKRAEKPPRQKPVLTAQPADPPKRKPMAPPVERPVPTMKPVEEVAAVLVAQAPSFPSSRPPSPEVEAAPPMPVVPLQTVPRRSTVGLDRLQVLLRDRKTLAAAFMLHEVFDPPLSMRRRRGPV